MTTPGEPDLTPDVNGQGEGPIPGLDGVPAGVTAGPINVNVNGRHGGVPGQEDVLLALGNARFQLAKELVTGSDNPHDYLAQSRLTLEEITTWRAMLADQLECKFGFVDDNHIMMVYLNMKIGQDGKARQEAIHVATHIPFVGGAFGGAEGLSRRARNPDGRRDS